MCGGKFDKVVDEQVAEEKKSRSSLEIQRLQSILRTLMLILRVGSCLGLSPGLFTNVSNLEHRGTCVVPVVPGCQLMK